MADATRDIAVAFVDELIRHGVRDAVVSPGSRSTPIALGFAERDEIDLHVRIDERSAAFLALGVAKASLRPVPVLCTSGSAAAHFHAAVLEADQSCIPLLALTADRPPELHGIGANQTIDQHNLYGGAVRRFVNLDVDGAADPLLAVRSLVGDAIAASSYGTAPGPVHLNIPLREPLVPAGGSARPAEPSPPHRAPTTHGSTAKPSPELEARVQAARRGVIVFGDDGHVTLADLAAQAGWPVIAEPHSSWRDATNTLRCVDPVLDDPAFGERYRPDLVVVVGRVGLSRSLLGWLSRVPHVVIDRYGRSLDVTRSAEAMQTCDLGWLPSDVRQPADPDWLAGWQQASAAAAAAIDGILDASEGLSEPRVARDLPLLLPRGSNLLVASSMPIRDLDLVMRPPKYVHIYANRGVSGIDGFVSTAQGIALTDPDTMTVALAGDLSMLHDANGLLPGPDRRPDVTYVVLNNDGGGIFSLLPQGAAVEPATFERLFGTPHGVDFARLAAAYDCGYTLATTSDELRAALQPGPGVRIVEIRTDRQENADLHRRLRAAAAEAVAAWVAGRAGGAAGSTTDS